jgi:diaminopimelate decarboxylase
MQGFNWINGQLHGDDIPLAAIAAAVGTPTYIYSASAIRSQYHRLEAAFSPLRARLRYALKASPNLHICKLLRGLGAGMDVVSGGELERAWLAGAPLGEVVFAGVGKSDAEIRAALDGRFSPLAADAARLGLSDPAARGPVGLFNVESPSELAAIARVAAELGARARVCLRVNPNVDPQTHEYTTTGKEENKFGIDGDQIVGIFDQWGHHPAVELAGLHAHIGSPVPVVEPYAEAIAVVLALFRELRARGHNPNVLDLGGGWPVDYTENSVPPIEDYAARIVPLLEAEVAAGLQVVMEPGRFLLANSGVLLSRIQHVKYGRAKTFVIGDAGMHNLIRPALYKAFHFVWPVAWSGVVPQRLEDPGLEGLVHCDLVGPICETGDFLARNRRLPPMVQGDLVAVFSAGAYGMSMASNYNDHGRPAEVLVDGSHARVVNERQSLAAVLATELSPRDLEFATTPPTAAGTVR